MKTSVDGKRKKISRSRTDLGVGLPDVENVSDGGVGLRVILVFHDHVDDSLLVVGVAPGGKAGASLELPNHDFRPHRSTHVQHFSS